MPLPLIAAGIGAVGSIAAAEIGRAAAAGDKARAQKLIQESLNEFKRLQIPSVEAQRLLLQEIQQQGILTPELEQAVTQGPSAYEGISIDPRLQEAQMGALDELSRIGEGGGLRLSDKATMEGALQDASTFERGQREAILQGARARGVAGSGTELAAQLLNQQGSAGRAHDAATQQAALAQDRALEALMAQGEQAGNLRGQSFNEQAASAQAADAIARFNAQNRASTQQRNVGAQNVAQEQNLGERQRVHESNIGTRNAQQQYNKQLLPQQFDMQRTLAGDVAQQRGNMANVYAGNAAETQQRYGGYGQALGQLGTSVGGYLGAQQASKTASDERQKDRDMWRDIYK